MFRAISGAPSLVQYCANSSSVHQRGKVSGIVDGNLLYWPMPCVLVGKRVVALISVTGSVWDYCPHENT